MTRQELATALLADNTKLNEKVYFMDVEYGRYFEVEVLKSIELDLQKDGEIVDHEPSERWVRNREKVLGMCTVLD